MNQVTLEIGIQVSLGDLLVNYHDVGSGEPVILIHGSGPGVSSWANWRLVIPKLQEHFRVIAPDMIGFGYTESPTVAFDIDAWVGEVIALADHLGIERFHLIGNSFGGAIAYHVAARHPERVKSLVAMGAVGAGFPITKGLDDVWAYTPDLATMAHLVRDVFAYNGAAMTDDLIELRFQATLRPTVQERYAALFPVPRQRWVDALAPAPEVMRGLDVPVLAVHGIQDQVIPIAASREAVRLLPNTRLDEIDRCGHWVQIEHTDEFVRLVTEFVSAHL